MKYIYIYTAVCKNFEPLIYISIYIYGVHCGKVVILENILGRKKMCKKSTCSHRKIFLLNILKMFIQITLPGSKFSSATLPTMHSIYLYTDGYQGLKSFANSRIYIYIYPYSLYIICIYIFPFSQVNKSGNVLHGGALSA